MRNQKAEQKETGTVLLGLEITGKSRLPASWGPFHIRTPTVSVQSNRKTLPARAASAGAESQAPPSDPGRGGSGRFCREAARPYGGAGTPGARWRCRTESESLGLRGHGKRRHRKCALEPASRSGQQTFWHVPARGRGYNRNRAANAGPRGGRARRCLGGSGGRRARLVLAGARRAGTPLAPAH